MKSKVRIKMNTVPDGFGFYRYDITVSINGRLTKYKRTYVDFTKALENVGYLELFYNTLAGDYVVVDSIV